MKTVQPKWMKIPAMQLFPSMRSKLRKYNICVLNNYISIIMCIPYSVTELDENPSYGVTPRLTGQTS